MGRNILLSDSFAGDSGQKSMDLLTEVTLPRMYAPLLTTVVLSYCCYGNSANSPSCMFLQ